MPCLYTACKHIEKPQPRFFFRIAGPCAKFIQLLQWTAAGDGKRFMLLVHHTDDQREYAYDKDSHIGKLDKALTAAETGSWTVVDMKKDWKVIYPFEVD